MGKLGNDQLAWLKQDVDAAWGAARRSCSLRTFRYGRVYPDWGWSTSDSEQALSLLKRFGSLTVLNGHIHQVMQKVEGNVTFHTAMSTAFPQPAPGTAPSPGPMKVPAEKLQSVLGLTEVHFVAAEESARGRGLDPGGQPAQRQRRTVAAMRAAANSACMARAVAGAGGRPLLSLRSSLGKPAHAAPPGARAILAGAALRGRFERACAEVRRLPLEQHAMAALQQDRARFVAGGARRARRTRAPEPVSPGSSTASTTASICWQRWARQLRQGKMPLKQYLLLHPEARLSDAERKLIRRLDESRAESACWPRRQNSNDSYDSTQRTEMK